jgi:hypothetical protein
MTGQINPVQNFNNFSAWTVALNRMTDGTSYKLRMVIHGPILSEECHIDMGRNLNHYVVIMNGNGGN